MSASHGNDPTPGTSGGGAGSSADNRAIEQLRNRILRDGVALGNGVDLTYLASCPEDWTWMSRFLVRLENEQLPTWASIVDPYGAAVLQARANDAGPSNGLRLDYFSKFEETQ